MARMTVIANKAKPTASKAKKIDILKEYEGKNNYF